MKAFRVTCLVLASVLSGGTIVLAVQRTAPPGWMQGASQGDWSADAASIDRLYNNTASSVKPLHEQVYGVRPTPERYTSEIAGLNLAASNGIYRSALVNVVQNDILLKQMSKMIEQNQQASQQASELAKEQNSRMTALVERTEALINRTDRLIVQNNQIIEQNAGVLQALKALKPPQ